MIPEDARRFSRGLLLLGMLVLWSGTFPLRGEAKELRLSGAPEDRLFSGFFVAALGELSSGALEGSFAEASSQEAGADLRICSLEELCRSLPEALLLGTPFLFSREESAAFFFEESRYWELLRKKFDQSGSPRLLAPAEARGFGILQSFAGAESPEDLRGLVLRTNWVGEALAFRALGAFPLAPSEDNGSAPQPQGRTALLPLEGGFDPRTPFPCWTFWNLFYELRFLTALPGWEEEFSPEERLWCLQAAEEANREVRELRRRSRETLLEQLQERGIKVYPLSPEQNGVLGAAVREPWIVWLRSLLPGSWIDLPLQEAQDANSMAEGQ